MRSIIQSGKSQGIFLRLEKSENFRLGKSGNFTPNTGGKNHTGKFKKHTVNITEICQAVIVSIVPHFKYKKEL